MKKWIFAFYRNAALLVRHLLLGCPGYRKKDGLPGNTHHTCRSAFPKPKGQGKRAPVSIGQRGFPRPNACDHLSYLLGRENNPDDIKKLNAILRMPQAILEIGCGTAWAARSIAQKNPGIGVIATDLYDWSHPQTEGSGYTQVARDWRACLLPAQIDIPSNLVILRAEADFLRCLPLRAVDTILLVNPEPRVGRRFLDLFQREYLSLKIKPGPVQIIILPHSRNLGVVACGGCSFEHDPDWSRGLGFMMASGLSFKLGEAVHWGMDLSDLSAYSGNSTQKGVYVFGCRQADAYPFPMGQDNSQRRQ